MIEPVCRECGWPWKVRSHGLCRWCEETRLEALDAALRELFWHGFGCHRASVILGVSEAMVRHHLFRKVPTSERWPPGRRVTDPAHRLCQNPECQKPFRVKDRRPWRGKYCCRPCRIAARRKPRPEVVEMRKAGYARKEVARALTISLTHVDRLWRTYRRSELGRPDSTSW